MNTSCHKQAIFHVEMSHLAVSAGGDLVVVDLTGSVCQASLLTALLPEVSQLQETPHC